MPDHIHLAIKIRSNQPLSDLVRKIKADSSKWINENQFCERKFSWQNGYGGFSVSASQIHKVRNYIENQVEHHKSKTFKEELIEIIDIHGVDYNPKIYGIERICAAPSELVGFGVLSSPGLHPGLYFLPPSEAYK